MKQIEEILDELHVYALTITDARLDDMKKDLNKEKPGKGTAMHNKFIRARKKLKKSRDTLKVYKDNTHPNLLRQAKDLVAKLEALRNTGSGTKGGMSLLAKLEKVVQQTSPLDDEVTDLLRKASRTSIRSVTLNHFGPPGSSRRIKFEDKAIDINRQISLLRNRRLDAIVDAFETLEPDIDLGIQALKKTTKRLNDIVAALKTLNTLLGIAVRVVGL